MRASAVAMIGCVIVKVTVFVITVLFLWAAYGMCGATFLFFLFTCLHTAGLGTKVGEINIGLPPIDDGVGVFAGTLRCPPVGHGHLEQTKVSKLR